MTRTLSAGAALPVPRAPRHSCSTSWPIRSREFPASASRHRSIFPFRAAAKTGTSRHFTDNWAVATTANFTVAVWAGNFSGRPMQAVSGISGAGPLLYRSVLQTAQRFSPGYLVQPERAGLAAAHVCILSGLRATPSCPSMVEWFAPGTEPQEADTWQSGSTVVLPPEYSEWSAANLVADAITQTRSEEIEPAARPHIISPLNGDRYSLPAGEAARYATIPLLAAGASAKVRWFVNGRPIHSTRWQLQPGTHVITAQWPDARRDSVRVFVETN